MDGLQKRSFGVGASNSFVSKDMIYTTAAIQKQIMSGLQNSGRDGQLGFGYGAGLSAVNQSRQVSRPQRDHQDQIMSQYNSNPKASSSDYQVASNKIEENKFPNRALNHHASKQQAEQLDRADTFLFRDEARLGRSLQVQKPIEVSEPNIKRARSPDQGGVVDPFKDEDRPKNSRYQRSGKSVESRALKTGQSITLGGGNATQKNFAFKQRQKHYADPVDYPQLNYEKRIKDLARNNITRTQLNPKVVETWLNETLTDAGHLEIPGVILQPESQKPLMRYKIGINQLKDNMISLDQTNRIYRALFVYSLGFYEMLHREISHSPNKNSIQNSIWKVYTILLEYCCKTNYQMQVRGLQIEHKAELEKEEERFNEYQDRMTKQENKLKDDLGILTVEHEKLTRKIEELTFQNKKLTDDMSKEQRTHEEEVQLRLQFESKLNSLHALHRDVKNLYSRAIEDILGLKTSNDEQEQVIKKYQDELIQLRSTKESNIQEINMLKETLTYSENEVNIKTIAIKKLQDEILQKDQENDKLQQEVNNQEQVYYGLQMEISKHQSDKQSLEQDKDRLKIELDLTKQMREQFSDQLEDVSGKYKELLGKYNSIQKDYVAIDELKRDRDYRINLLRSELTELSEKHETQAKELAALNIRYETTTSDFENLKKEDEKLVIQLEQANLKRREQEEKFHLLKEDSKLVSQKFDLQKDEIANLKKLNDKLQMRLDHAECDLAELQVRYDSEQKQSEIQRQQLNDKLKNLDQLLCNEKDTRETWMAKCQLEQEMHTKTNMELLRIRSLHQNAEMEYKNALINFETVKQARQNLSKEHETLLKEASQLRAKNENLEREVHAKVKLLESNEQQQTSLLRRMREENRQVIEQYEGKVLEKMMEYEDLRSYCVKNFDYVQKLNQEIDDLKDKLRTQKEENQQLDKRIDKLEKQIYQEVEKNQGFQNEMRDLNILNSRKQTENERLQKNISEQASKIQQMNEDAKKTEEQLKIIPELEQNLKETEKKLKQSQDLLQKQLTHSKGVENGWGPQSVIYTDQEAQTEVDLTGMDPSYLMVDGQLDAQFDYSSQQNSFQNTQVMQQQRNMQMKMATGATTGAGSGDNLSAAPMNMGNQHLAVNQGLSSQSHQGMVIGSVTPKTHQMNPQIMFNQGSHMNISQSNVRQTISLGKNGGIARIQSAANTGQSTGVATRYPGQAQQMNMISQGYKTGMSSHCIINSQTGGLESQSKSKTQIHRTISGEGDSRSTDRKNNFMQASLVHNNQTHISTDLGKSNMAAAMGVQAGLDLSIDENVQRYGQTSKNRPTTGVPQGYRNNIITGETPLIQGQIAPHALYNHHAYSKKSFRIRGQAEQEFMKMQSSSNKDMAMIDFNNDILKSVYELRKSHAALACRPTTQQLITKGRRDIQSAAARQKEMAFGGFMIPSQVDRELAIVGSGHMDENIINQFQMMEPNQIQEFNEQIAAHDTTLQVKDKKAKSMRTSIPSNAPVPRHPGPISQIQIQQKPALSTMKQKKSATVGMKSPMPENADNSAVDGIRSNSNISGAPTGMMNQHAIPVKQGGLRNINESMSISGASVHVMANALTGANPHQKVPHHQQPGSTAHGIPQQLSATPTLHVGSQPQQSQQHLMQNCNNSVLTSGGGSQTEGLRMVESLQNFNMNAVITTKSAGNIYQRAKSSSTTHGGAGRNIKNIIKMASSREGLRD